MDELLDYGRILRVRSGHNVRELGGYVTPRGKTQTHRFLRSGSTGPLSAEDLDTLRSWGVRYVLDLRGIGETPAVTCSFAKLDWVTWANVPLYDRDLSAPAMAPIRAEGSFLATSYLTMLRSENCIRRIFAFLAQAEPDDCVLFHCAAGIDRTGVLAMLLLGLAEVGRRDIIADYAYSFGTVPDVEMLLGSVADADVSLLPKGPVTNRMQTIATVYDTVVATHGSVRGYLQSCEVPEAHIDAVFSHLVDA